MVNVSACWITWEVKTVQLKGKELWGWPPPGRNISHCITFNHFFNNSLSSSLQDFQVDYFPALTLIVRCIKLSSINPLLRIYHLSSFVQQVEFHWVELMPVFLPGPFWNVCLFSHQCSCFPLGEAYVSLKSLLGGCWFRQFFAFRFVFFLHTYLSFFKKTHWNSGLKSRLCFPGIPIQEEMSLWGSWALQMWSEHWQDCGAFPWLLFA